MELTEMIENKKSKIESSLCELFSEISTATKYLLQLKENSAAVVKNLNNISKPSTFLQEFMNVNSFLLKSITFLTEINCKFEMLDISDKWMNSLISSSKVVLSGVDDKSGKHLNCVALQQVGSKGSNSEVLKNVIVNKPSKVCVTPTLKVIKRKKPKKKKSKKSQQQQRENKVTNINCAESISKSSNVNAFSYNDSRSSHSAGAKEKSNSGKKTRLDIPAGAKTSSDLVLSAEECSIKRTDDQNPSRSSILRGGSCQNNEKKTKEEGILNFSEDNKNPATLLCNTLHTAGDIPVAEVVPTTVWDWWYNSKVPEDFDCDQDSEGDNPAVSQIKMEKEDEEDDIKPVKLVRKLGEQYDVVIEHIKSPSEFYVSLLDKHVDLLKEMEEELKLIPVNKNDAHCKKDRYTKSMLSSEIGKYALVYLKCDEMWCRAKITNWCLNYNDDFVNVFLLDYGESKCVSTNDLQRMPDYIKKYPACIFRCHLYDVFPVDMDVRNDKISWERESSEKMKTLTENSKCVRIKVAPNDRFHPSASLPVTLWLLDQDNQCVNNLLVKTRYAIHGPNLKKSEIKSDKLETDIIENDFLDNWNPMKEDFESYQNSYDLDINDPAAVIYGYVGKDYERVCKHFAKTGHCFKGEACRHEHKRLDRLGFTTDQEEVYQSAFNNLPVPPPNSIVNVQVTCLLNYNTFFCFLEDYKSSFNEEDLQSLLKYMNKKENILKMKQLLIPPSPGQIVIARYSEDEAWYRARILESQPENDKYTVVFVDYGNKETKPLSQIRAIEAQYLHLPFQAVQCFIFGIEQNPKVPSKEIMDYVKKRMDDGHISIEVIARLPGDHVNLLVNVFDHEGGNIGEDLIAKEYAFSKKEMLVNSGSDSLPG